MCNAMEATMTKKRIEVGIGSLREGLDGFEKAWRDAEKGVARTPVIRLTFESLPLLLKNLTPARWALLEYLKRHGPLSINELAKRLERHYKNVHTDVARLIDLGLVERGKDQRVAVLWDVVAAEMRLAA
jgi:predicted transcriptional regulator